MGDREIGDDGLARRGVLIRHLVMPGNLDETREVLEWIVAELGPDTYVNLMDQQRLDRGHWSLPGSARLACSVP